MKTYHSICFFMAFVFWLIIGCGGNMVKNNSPKLSNILLSPVTDMEVIEGTRTKVFLSAIDDHLEDLEFTCISCPPGTHLSKTNHGKCIFIIDAKEGAPQKNRIAIRAKNGTDSAMVEFNLTISKHMGPIYYCSPKQKTVHGKGTKESPFPGFQSVIETGFSPEKNALFLLTDGFHGAPEISYDNVTIAAAAGNEPLMASIYLNHADHVVLSGLNIGYYHGHMYFPKKYMLEIDSLSSNISVQNCKVESNKSTANWNEANWKEKAGNGIKCQAPYCSIQGNLIRNIFHGIKTENNNIRVKYNTVDRFSGDAIRNTGSNNSFVFNLMKNATIDDYYDPDGNHDDLFQSWTFDKPIENIELKNNIAISCLEPDLPLKAKVVQGLVCFDGFEKNWTIENNLVVTDHPHGIALYGADNCRITHNTVLKNPLRLFYFESEPWIMVNKHKDGRESINCEVLDNYTAALNIVSKDVLEKNNTIIDSLHTKLLKDYQGWDFRIK